MIDLENDRLLSLADAAKLLAGRPIACIYETREAVAPANDPDWEAITTGLPLGELLRLAFRNRLIDRQDHPILLSLRSET
jgi:hypothetical protein